MCLFDAANLPFVTMLTTTSIAISSQLTAGDDGQLDVALRGNSVKWEQQPLFFFNVLTVWNRVADYGQRSSNNVHRAGRYGLERIHQVLFDGKCLSRQNVFTAFTDLIGYPMANFGLQRQKEHCLLMSPWQAVSYSDRSSGQCAAMFEIVQ